MRILAIYAAIDPESPYTSSNIKTALATFREGDIRGYERHIGSPEHLTSSTVTYGKTPHQTTVCLDASQSIDGYYTASIEPRTIGMGLAVVWDVTFYERGKLSPIKESMGLVSSREGLDHAIEALRSLAASVIVRD